MSDLSCPLILCLHKNNLTNLTISRLWRCARAPRWSSVRPWLSVSRKRSKHTHTDTHTDPLLRRRRRMMMMDRYVDYPDFLQSSSASRCFSTGARVGCCNPPFIICDLQLPYFYDVYIHLYIESSYLFMCLRIDYICCFYNYIE